MSIKIRILDTNYFVRFILDDIPEQVEITENVLKKGAENKLHLIITTLAIVELNNVLLYEYKLEKKQRLEALKLITNIHHLDYPDKKDKEITGLAITYFNKYNLDLEDCYNIAYAKIRDWELFTFDTELKKVAKIEGIRRMP